jgi:hypothetical protein
VRLGVPQAGVEISLNNTVQGTTDSIRHVAFASGRCVHVRQEVAVDDRSLPLDYTLSTRKLLIAPAFKGGSIADFAARAVRAYAGKASRMSETARGIPVANSQVVHGQAAGMKIEIETTQDGRLLPRRRPSRPDT